MLKPLLGGTCWEEHQVQAFVEARYEYHWMPLVGCLVAQMRQIDVPHSSFVIGAATGLLYQAPHSGDLPPTMRTGLSALGANADVVDRSDPGRLQRILARRLIRRELRADRPVTSYGVGVSAFGPTFGLIVGCDDARRAWRRDGPMTEQVSPWLSEADFNAASRLTLIATRPSAASKEDDLVSAASRALTASLDSVRCELFNRVDVLQSDLEIEPQRYSHEAQTLAACWGEAAMFWREHPDSDHRIIARQMAVTLSRYATLFPYPMGGQPNNPGVRTAATRILEEAASQLA